MNEDIKQETVADIVAKWMPHFKKYADPKEGAAGFDMAEDAVSALEEVLEAAKRETVTNCNGFGNVAKLREALELAKKAICHSARYVCQSLSSETGNIQSSCADVLCPRRELCKAKTAINAALAAPPRNCDVYLTPEEMHKAWEQSGSRKAFSDWLLSDAYAAP